MPFVSHRAVGRKLFYKHRRWPISLLRPSLAARATRKRARAEQSDEEKGASGAKQARADCVDGHTAEEKGGRSVRGLHTRRCRSDRQIIALTERPILKPWRESCSALVLCSMETEEDATRKEANQMNRDPNK